MAHNGGNYHRRMAVGSPSMPVLRNNGMAVRWKSKHIMQLIFHKTFMDVINIYGHKKSNNFPQTIYNL